MPALVGQSERPPKKPIVATFILSFQLPTPGRTHPFWSPVRHVRLDSDRSYTSHHALRSRTRLSVERWSVSATCIAATDHFALLDRTTSRPLASTRTRPFLVPGPESPAGIQTISCQHRPPHFDIMPALVGQSERPKIRPYTVSRRPPQQVTPPRNRPLSPGAAAFTLQT